jgi:SAM-dependent methyltransferase
VREAYARRAQQGHGDRYTHFNSGNLLMIQDRERAIIRALKAAGFFPLSERHILEVGCGAGYWLRQFIQWGAEPARVCGVELLRERAEEAIRRCPAAVQVLVGDAAQSPLQDHTFDLVCQFTVFTSILDDDTRRALAAEMLRLVKPNGLILWCDFRYHDARNPDVRGIGRAEIRRLFPDCGIRVRSLTLAPVIARTLAPVSWWLCETLNLLPLLRTHLLALIRPAT